MARSKTGRKPNDITGKVYGNLKAIKPCSVPGSNELLWELKCLACGTRCHANSSDLRRGRRGACPVCREKKSKEMPYVCLFGNYRRGAEKRHRKWKLSFDEFMELVHSNCFYCSRPPSQILRKEGWLNEAVYNGIDRINNDEDYTKKNCVPCCKYCNLSKSRWSVSEFIEWINEVRSNHDYRTVLTDKTECLDNVIRSLFGKVYRIVREVVSRNDRITVVELLDN